MEHIKIENREGLLIISMARGKANALNSQMIDELNSGLMMARGDEGVRGVVLASDRANLFSGGFDVMEVFQYDRAAMADFFGRFIDLYEGMMSLPKPVVAAVNGHAFAGGAVLALASDARVMAEGKFGFALNEVNIGLVVPPGMMRMAINAVGLHKAREMVLGGKTFTPAESFQIGLASELADSSTVVERALALAGELAAKPPLTFGTVKKSFNEVSGLIRAGGDRQYLGEFIAHWFSAESTEHRQALIESLRR